MKAAFALCLLLACLCTQSCGRKASKSKRSAVVAAASASAPSVDMPSASKPPAHNNRVRKVSESASFETEVLRFLNELEKLTSRVDGRDTHPNVKPVKSNKKPEPAGEGVIR